jgi:tetratricopeptide (TPR) repeat protein
MVAAARQLGLVVIESSKKADLFELINAGFPVIVLLNQGTDALPVWHYAVAVGYDLERQEVILRSGETKRQVMKLSSFYEFFKKSGYWKLIAVPATMVPPTVGEAAYIKAVYDLDRTLENEIVQEAYETALAEWPHSHRVKLAAANYFFDTYQYETAQTLYGEVLRKLPDDPIALNNMAETLYYLGEFAEALTFIDKAIKKNRKFNKEFDDTRKKILNSIESGKIILRNGL